MNKLMNYLAYLVFFPVHFFTRDWFVIKYNPDKDLIIEISYHKNRSFVVVNRGGIDKEIVHIESYYKYSIPSITLEIGMYD